MTLSRIAVSRFVVYWQIVPEESSSIARSVF